MNIHEKNYVVISAHQPDNDAVQNSILQAKLICDILDLIGFSTQVVQTTGRYNGIEEESFAVVMPEAPAEFERISNGLIELGDKYNQMCLLLVFNTDDPPTAVLYPLARGIKEGYTEYIHHPWIEVDCDDCKNLENFVGLTRVMDKCFIIDEDSDVTPDEIQLLDKLTYVFGPDNVVLVDDLDDIDFGTTEH